MRVEFEDIDARGYSDPDMPGFISRTDDGFAYLDGDGKLHEFDASGRLTRVIDRKGFTLTMGYDGDQLTTVTDHFDRALQLEDLPDGRLSEHRDARWQHIPL
ncbi:MAG: RHS repeat domain-containing protein [Gammaproteobacteria bacterium]|nr:RHS repeat domain-containing protein [Gammaproteobacteria bacterium]